MIRVWGVRVFGFCGLEIRSSGFGFREGIGCRGFWFWGFGARTWTIQARHMGRSLRTEGLEFRVSGSGFRV